MNTATDLLLKPEWPAPDNVRAVATTRCGGFSLAPYDSFNPAAHVGDDAQSVHANRKLLIEEAGLPGPPVWMRQAHETRCLRLEGLVDDEPTADAAVATTAGRVCAVLTADCLPILLCAKDGSQIGAVHAGWRGLSAGVIENALQTFPPQTQLIAWLGPAIGPHAYEVGADVLNAFGDDAAGDAFCPASDGKYLADLYRLASTRLETAGVDVHGGGFCTFSDEERFFSYRRDGVTGRMASVIWMV